MDLSRIKITPLLETLRLQKISDEVYFSEKYKNYVSNSRLGYLYDFENKVLTPGKFFEGLKPTYSVSFALGSAVHSICLQSEFYHIVTEVDKPTGKMGLMAEEIFKTFTDNITDEQIIHAATKFEYYGGILSEKKINNIRETCLSYCEQKKSYLENYNLEKEPIFLDPKTRETALNCIQAVNDNEWFQNLLHPTGIVENPISENELGILFDIEIEVPNYSPFILRLKAKLDNFTIDKEQNIICVNDIKTARCMVNEFETGNLLRFHYNRELAFYSWLLSLCAKKFYNMEDFSIKGNYLVVSTIPQYYTKVVPMTSKMFREGWNEVNFLLKCLASLIVDKYQDFVEWKN